jgi:hypothetical protein
MEMSLVFRGSFIQKATVESEELIAGKMLKAFFHVRIADTA